MAQHASLDVINDDNRHLGGHDLFHNAHNVTDSAVNTSLHHVHDFVNAYNLSHKTAVFEKAAQLLTTHQNNHEFQDIGKDELTALDRERSHKWHQPLSMYLTILATALGSMGQGWAQTSMNGANLYFPQAFGIGSHSRQDDLIVGMINSGLYLSNGLLGAWLVAPLNDKIGRRGAILSAALVSCLTNIGSGLAQNWVQLLISRLVLGCALGVISSTLNIFAAECAPASIRGALAVSWQMFCAFGIFIGFIMNVAVYDYGPNTWRFQLAAAAIPTIPLMMVIYLCPESAAWHVKSGRRYDRAMQSLTRLRNTELQAARELYQSYMQSTASTWEKSTYFKSLAELFSIPRIRRATIAAYTVMLAQQLCGINIISFYSSTIFADANFSTFGALLASVAFGFVNFVGAFPAIWTMDSLGRRSLLLVTLPFMAVTMFAAGLSFSIPADNPAHFGLLASMIYLFCAEYSPGMGPVPAAYAAEVFPLSHREIGMSSAVAVTNIWAAVLSLTFPSLISQIGSQGSFMLYAVLNVVALILVFLFVPETKLKTLDELDGVFEISTRRCIKFECTQYLPWLYRRYMKQDKDISRPEITAEQQYKVLIQDEE